MPQGDSDRGDGKTKRKFKRVLSAVAWRVQELSINHPDCEHAEL